MSPSDASRGIDIHELARRNGVIEGRVPFEAATRLRIALRSGAGAIEFRLQGLIDERGRTAARLRVQADLPLTCDRCGQALVMPLRHEAAFYFLRSEGELSALPVSADDEAEPLLGSDSFAVATLVEDETILSIPVSPRHTECPQPAGNRPELSAEGARANPFAGLRGRLRKDAG
jgi:uncharacterized protein